MRDENSPAIFTTETRDNWREVGSIPRTPWDKSLHLCQRRESFLWQKPNRKAHRVYIENMDLIDKSLFAVTLDSLQDVETGPPPVEGDFPPETEEEFRRNCHLRWVRSGDARTESMAGQRFQSRLRSEWLGGDGGRAFSLAMLWFPAW